MSSLVNIEIWENNYEIMFAFVQLTPISWSLCDCVQHDYCIYLAIHVTEPISKRNMFKLCCS